MKNKFNISKWKTWKDSLINKDVDCLHSKCSECNGTGRKKDETACVHMISCPCSRCIPRYY